MPRTGSKVSHRCLTFAVVDSRAFLSAKRRKEFKVHCPESTRIAFSGGDYQAYHLIWSVPDAMHQKYPDMVLLHGGTSKGAEMIAARWADTRGVTQMVFKPN
jgi:poly(3-hydroxybutyrate) depolymerase